MGKDPNAPARPLTAFFRYAATQRAECSRKGMSGPEAAIEIGKRWGKLTDNAKGKYQKEFQKEKVGYSKAFLKYKKTDDYAAYRKLKKEKIIKKALLAAKKDPARPRKPASAYFLYADDVRDEVSEDLDTFSIGGLSKVVAKQWKQLSASQKKKYQDRAAVLATKYAKDKDAYRQSESYLKHRETLDRLTGKTKALADKEKAKAQKEKARAAQKKRRETQQAKDAKKRAVTKARKEKLRSKKKAAAERKKAATAKKKAAAKKKVAKKKAAAAKKKAAKKSKKVSKKSKKSKKSKAKKTSKKRKPSKKVVKKRSAARRSKKRVVKRRK